MTLGMPLVTGRPPPASPPDDALRRQVAELEPELRRRALALTGSAADASDLVQDTVERAFRTLHRFQPGTNLRVWLTTIMRNLFIDGCRYARSRARVFQASSTSEPLETPSTEPDERGDLPIWGRISTQQFHAAIDRLDPVMRDVVKLRLIHRLPYAEIAAQLKIPTATVGTRLSRARLRLRAILLEILGLVNPDGPLDDKASVGSGGEAL
jgi:RNA polymerase sigma-70 factor (ECF subfamily)